MCANIYFTADRGKIETIPKNILRHKSHYSLKWVYSPPQRVSVVVLRMAIVALSVLKDIKGL